MVSQVTTCKQTEQRKEERKMENRDTAELNIRILSQANHQVYWTTNVIWWDETNRQYRTVIHLDACDTISFPHSVAVAAPIPPPASISPVAVDPAPPAIIAPQIDDDVVQVFPCEVCYEFYPQGENPEEAKKCRTCACYLCSECRWQCRFRSELKGRCPRCRNEFVDGWGPLPPPPPEYDGDSSSDFMPSDDE